MKYSYLPQNIFGDTLTGAIGEDKSFLAFAHSIGTTDPNANAREYRYKNS
jgi:hypothetical protein